MFDRRGGPGGRVYQKAYVEFFTSENKLKLLMLNLFKFPSLNLYAINHAGVSHFGGGGKKGISLI